MPDDASSDAERLLAEARRDESNESLGKLVRINAFAKSAGGLGRLKEARSKKVLLVAPTSTHDVGMTKWLSVNLGIERIAGVLRKHDHHVETYDVNMYRAMGTGQGRDDKSFEQKLREHDWDVVGFGVYEATMVNDFANMQLASEVRPGAVLVAGGHAAQFDYQEILDKTPCRIVVLGEGERPMLELLKGTALQDISGVVFRSNARPMDAAEFHEATHAIEYETLPYELLWDHYLKIYRDSGVEITPDLSRTIHTIRVYTRNYCPMNCKFCSSTNWLTFASKGRVKIADVAGAELVELLQRIIAAHPRVETFYFTDDEFCIVRDKLLEFLHAVIEAELGVTFICFTRIDDLDEEVISLMARAGFRTLNIGVESFQEEILREFHKSVSVDQIDRALDLLEKYGIRPSCSFILASPEARLEWVGNVARRIREEIQRGRLHAGVNATTQPQKGSGFFEEYGEFEIEHVEIPGTRMLVKQYHFVKCVDPEVREFQYRLLFRWAQFVEDYLERQKGHVTSQAQSIQKIDLVLELVDEIQRERGTAEQLRYTNKTREEKKRAWEVLARYSYGASI
jgi:radical SAM superfamily enzyme YgiQ (UPF0313 family)